MKILTLNDNKKQLRCKPSPASQLGFQYEYMINNEWTPVTHKEVRVLWGMLQQSLREGITA